MAKVLSASGGCTPACKHCHQRPFRLTTLNIAVLNGDTPMVEYLISKGASANETDGDKISMLEWAAIGNRLSTAETLLRRGANVNHVDGRGMTALLYATSIDYGDTAMIQRLVAAGADTSTKNKDGLTALELAKSYNHSPSALLLSGKGGSR